MDGKSWRLTDEVRYVQRRAARRDGRFVRVDRLILFSTDSGDAWLLDPSERLATRLAREGEPEPVHIEESDTNFAVAWTGYYRIKDTALSTANTPQGASQPFWATLRTGWPNWADDRWRARARGGREGFS